MIPWISVCLALLVCGLAAAVTALRFGTELVSLATGDGQAVLAMASSVLNVWIFVFGGSVTAVSAAFQLSSLNPDWKLPVFLRSFSRTILPFALLGIISGTVAMGGILNVNTSQRFQDAQVAPWLVAGFALQIVLLAAGVVTAFDTYRQLTVVEALSSTLSSLTQTAQEKLVAEYRRILTDPSQRDVWSAFRAGIGPSLSGSAAITHAEFQLALQSVVLNTNPQVHDAAVARVREWSKGQNLSPLDGYFEHYLVPALVHAARVDSQLVVLPLYSIRLLTIARLVIVLGECGATGTEINSANDLWEMIDARAELTSMSETLLASWLALSPLLQRAMAGTLILPIHLWNLQRAVQSLVAEGTPQAIAQLERIFRHYRDFLGRALRNAWPESRNQLDRLLELIGRFHQSIDDAYGDEPVVWAQMHDLRYWMLIGLRREQEAFVETMQSRSLDDTQRSWAADDFDVLGDFIVKLRRRREISGDAGAHDPVRFPLNPFRIEESVA